MGLGPIPKDMTDSEDPLWKASFLLGEQKGYGIGRVLVGGGGAGPGEEGELGLTCKIIFLIKIKN